MLETTNSKPSRSWLWAALFLTSLLTLWWSVSEYRSKARQIEQEMASLQECHELATKIATWNLRPTVATLDVTSPQKLTQQITSCVRTATIPKSSLLSISPGEPSQISGRDYRQRITAVRLGGVTLANLAKLQQAFDAGEGLYIRDVRLTVADSNASNDAERWDALLTLTQLIYSPKSQ